MPLETKRLVEASESPLLSVLVPTVAGRERKLEGLLAVLQPQCSARNDIELIVMRDGRLITIGRKRNLLVAESKGEYIVFIDDDDMVVGNYVERITSALETKPHVVCFMVRVEGYGSPKPCRYGLALGDVNHGHEYHRRPNHLMAWRRDLAASTPFPDVRRGEDTLWARAMCTKASVEVVIDATLYTYRFDRFDNSTMTARRHR